MKLTTCFRGLVLGCAVSLSPAQQASSTIPLLTVCEALRELDAYRGTDVVIVGEEGWTFEGWYLGESCGNDDQVLLQGNNWPSTIRVDDVPIRGQRQLEVWNVLVREELILEKLKQVKGYPPLPEPTRSQRGPRIVNVKWVALYGKLDSPASLSPPRRNVSDGKVIQGNGYGANGSVPAKIQVVAAKVFYSR